MGRRSSGRGAERDYDKAKAELDAEDKNIATLNSRIASTEKALPGARAAVQEADKKVKEAGDATNLLI
ncbi:hypothetical protein [Klebsiella pneumoniae]|uniref:hypothetical protein n=1 Tax=Klebsiella pneumoniae TaxID=573 RepID=UPI003DA0ACCF